MNKKFKIVYATGIAWPTLAFFYTRRSMPRSFRVQDETRVTGTRLILIL